MALRCSRARWRQRPHGGISSLTSGALGTGVQLGMSMLIARLLPRQRPCAGGALRVLPETVIWSPWSVQVGWGPTLGLHLRILGRPARRAGPPTASRRHRRARPRRAGPGPAPGTLFHLFHKDVSSSSHPLVLVTAFVHEPAAHQPTGGVLRPSVAVSCKHGGVLRSRPLLAGARAANIDSEAEVPL